MKKFYKETGSYYLQYVQNNSQSWVTYKIVDVGRPPHAQDLIKNDITHLFFLLLQVFAFGLSLFFINS
jgi:hypothetical protein